MSFPVPPPSPTETVADPDVLAADAAAGPAAGPAADDLVAAARHLAAVLVAVLPGGRAAPLAAAVAEHWAALARTWADAVTEHREHLAGAATAFARLDDDAAARLDHRVALR